MKPRYVLMVDPGHAATTSSGARTVTLVASVTVVKVPWWKWWRR